MTKHTNMTQTGGRWMSEFTDKWMADHRRHQQEAAAKRRAEWREDHTDIPDLEFSPPDCPICWETTDFDDGWFTCEACDVAWPENGYGHLACHADGSRFARPTTGEPEG